MIRTNMEDQDARDQWDSQTKRRKYHYINTTNGRQICKVPLTEDDIQACHRTSTKDTAPIIVKFKHRPDRNQLMEARKKSKDITKVDLGFELKDANGKGKIFINESLTHRNKVLFRKAREKKVELNFEYVWTHNSKIFIRKN